MAYPPHIAILEQGVESWNNWRKENPRLHPDLSDADLTGKNLSGANLSFSRFYRTKLTIADLREANLSNAVLNQANLWDADLSGATLNRVQAQNAEMVRTRLRGVKILGTDFYESNFRGADFSRAIIKKAFFENALLIKTNFESATLDDCYVHGASVWEVNLDKAIQRDLRIGPLAGPYIRIDSLEIAQFIHLLLNNKKIRDVISNLTTKVVLILGRFTEERKCILDAIRQALPSRNLVPIIFDFEPSSQRDLTETVMVLASLAKFVIADLTDARSIPQELSHIIPLFPSVPIQPILLASQSEYSMFKHWRSYPWVLPEFRYENEEHLLTNLDQYVIEPASGNNSS